MKSNTVIRISIVLSILVLLSGCNGGGTSNNPQNGSPSIPEININAIPTPTVSPTPASTPVESVLYSFQGGSDGSSPRSALIMGANGNLYGTTYYGGAMNYGTVFKITSQGQETILYSFQGGNDGANPLAGLILDATGNLYGTTYEGGGKDTGTVFKISPQGQEIILYRFQSGFDARNPAAGLIMDVNGNLYGTTAGGGSNYSGAVFKITPQGEETVLYSLHLFENDGAHPVASLIMDANGNLYMLIRFKPN